MKMILVAASLVASLFCATDARADYRMDICAPGNIWDGTASTGAFGVPALAMLEESQDHISVLGHTSGATTLHVLASMDDVTYYDTGIVIPISGASDFSFTFQYQTVFLTFMSENDVTVTASICAYEE